MSNGEKVAIIGSGLIGRSYACLFVSAGYNVSLCDIDPNQLNAALTSCGDSLTRLKVSISFVVPLTIT
jgi:L-gulonate 3-dehydrogenase